MNKEQIDEYLVSIGGLVNAYYVDERPPIKNANFFAVDEGWYELIKDKGPMNNWDGFSYMQIVHVYEIYICKNIKEQNFLTERF